MGAASPKMKSPPASDLTLNDIWGQIHWFRQLYQLSDPTFTLEKLERNHPLVKEAVATLLKETMERNILAAIEHPSLSELGQPLEEEREDDQLPSIGFGRSLRCVLEAALQTLTLLPDKNDPDPDYGTKNTKSLSLSLNEVAGELEKALRFQDVFGRFTDEDRTRLHCLRSEIAWASDALKSALSNKRRLRTDSRKPQVRWALYLINWFERCTGRKHNEFARTLMTASFIAADKTPPKFLNGNGLEVAMNSKHKKRKAWMDSVPRVEGATVRTA
jgi:hypothetical protein